MKARLFLIFFTLSLYACTSTQMVQIEELDQNLFSGFQQVPIIAHEDIFELSDEAKTFARETVKPYRNQLDQAEALLKTLFAANKLNLDYRSTANYTASETYERGVANCISLTIFAYAMFEYLGINSNIQDVQIPEYWTIRSREVLINGHVNLKVKPKHVNFLDQYSNEDIVVDFDPQADTGAFDAIPLRENELVSLYYNNVGAEYLINEQNIEAYAYFRAAIAKDPRNTSAWSNLGTLYSRNKLLYDAEKAYRTALAIDSKAFNTLENLAIVLTKQGNIDQANDIFNNLHNLRKKNPYYHLMLGDQALYETEPELALSHFQSAIELHDESHLLHFALARAYIALGNVEMSKESLIKAKELSEGSRDQHLYSQKLSLFSRL